MPLSAGAPDPLDQRQRLRSAKKKRASADRTPPRLWGLAVSFESVEDDRVATRARPFLAFCRG
jgi:hypothetical protein